MPRTAHFKRFEHSAGFTLVELMTVIVIVGVILPVIAAIMIYSYKDAQAANSRVYATTQLRQALNFMDKNVSLSVGFLTGLSSGFSDPYGQNNTGTSGANAWSYKGVGSGNRVLITSDLATAPTSNGSGRQLVYERSGNPDFNCTDKIYYQPVHTYVSIYFIHNTTLYRRIVTDTTTPLCNSQAQHQSCPPYAPYGESNWNSICQANDEAIASNITAMDIAYYQLNGSSPSTPVDPSFTSTDPNVLQDASYVVITLKAAATDGTTYSMTQRITKVN